MGEEHGGTSSRRGTLKTSSGRGNRSIVITVCHPAPLITCWPSFLSHFISIFLLLSLSYSDTVISQLSFSQLLKSDTQFNLISNRKPQIQIYSKSSTLNLNCQNLEILNPPTFPYTKLSWTQACRPLGRVSSGAEGDRWVIGIWVLEGYSEGLVFRV